MRRFCLDHGLPVDGPPSLRRAPDCGGRIRFDYGTVVDEQADDRSMWRYRSRLPIPPEVAPVSLGEGGTPLIASRLDLGADVRWKDETRNPSGSHKDRALSVALTQARAMDATVVAVASAGSTALSAATYAAAAGIRCIVLVGEDASDARLLPLLFLGAEVHRVHGSVDDALDLLADAADRISITDVSTTRLGNPWGAEAPATIAWEILADLGRVPDWVVVPVGGGGTLAGIGRGFADLVELGLAERQPRLASYQPTGYPTLVVARERGFRTDAQQRDAAPAARPPTVQVKIAHTYAPDGAEALAALERSGGVALAVTDEEALDGVARLGRGDGLYVEPSSGGVVAAVEHLVRDGHAGRDDLVVGLIGGSGFREAEILGGHRRVEAPFLEGDTIDALRRLAAG